jgi:polyhydroxyalkanoate synthase
MADAPKPDAPTPPQIDPEALQKSLASIAERSAKIVSEFVEKQSHPDAAQPPADDLGINRAFMELAKHLWSDPAKLAETQVRAWDDYLKLWQAMIVKATGGQPEPVKAPARGDNRFKSELWESNFLFDYIKQSYLIAADHVQRTVAETQGLDSQTARKVKFFTRQFVDALAPTNFALTNPEVLKATSETGGQNLLKGLEHLLKDLERGHGKLAISMTDYEAFRLGENVATTPGKVIYQNDLMQLLQFEPTTPQVDKAPLLIVPPWINKYYILDLRARNSFIKWAVDQGITVFVISWVNPDERHSQKTFGDYMMEGPVSAMTAIEAATGERAINLIGYCLGGTLTACLMSWLASTGRADRVKSVTYFTTMLDFTEPGELGVFVDEESVANIEKRMAARGFLEGSEMATTFNMLRDNDLIWSFVVNNYLLGKEPFPFDLLFWNSDSTRMPPQMHTFYLRNMYIRNLLTQPEALELCGEKIDLSLVDTPTYFISAMEDHIAPWKSTYAGAQLFSGPVRFVLGGSGHIAGIVNPPVAQKYCYWTNGNLPSSADTWLGTATRHEGSWWEDWGRWIAGFGGGKVAPRIPGDRALKVIEAAPGSYAKLRLDSMTPETSTAAARPSAPEAAVKAAPAVAPAPAATRSPAAAPRAPAKTKTSGSRSATTADITPAPAAPSARKSAARGAKDASKSAPDAKPAKAAATGKASTAAPATTKAATPKSATKSKPAAAKPAPAAPKVGNPASATAAPAAAEGKPKRAPKSAAAKAESPAEMISALFRAQSPAAKREAAQTTAPAAKPKRKR